MKIRLRGLKAVRRKVCVVFAVTVAAICFIRWKKDVGDIAMAALHGPIDRLPEGHYYYDSRTDWVETNDDLPKLGGADGIQPLD